MSVAAAAVNERATEPSGIRSLLGILLPIATVLLVLFQLPAYVTVVQGPVAYPVGIGAIAGRAQVTAVGDPTLLRQGVRAGQSIAWPRGESEWRAGMPRVGDALFIRTPHGLVTVRAARHAAPTVQIIVNAITVTTSLCVFILAGVLCYKRPGIMTLALWIFVSINFDIQLLYNYYQQLPETIAHPLVVFVTAFFGGWAYFPIVWFALRFPNDSITSRSIRIADYAWTAIAAAAFGWFFFDISRTLIGYGGPEFDVVENMLWRYTIPQNIPCVAGLAAFLWTYTRSGEVTRRRIAWATAGFVTMFVLETMGNFATELFPSLQFAGFMLFMLVAFCPLAMMYAVLRHHLLDITFVVNRALVYSILTALIVAVVGIVDWVAGKYLFETRAALAVEALVTIGLGFVLQSVHGALERAVDRVIFARRHAAERHIERVIAALAFARSHDAVLRALVDDPQAALDIAPCGVFLSEGSTFVLRAAHGTFSRELSSIAADDSLARLLLAERRAVVVGEVHWQAAGAGGIDTAVPLFSRNDLLGIALYGRHRNGSTIDPEERALLSRLCDAGAVAYEAVALAEARAALQRFEAGMAHGATV